MSWSAVAGAGAYSVGLRDLNTNQLYNIPLLTGTSTLQSITAGHSYRWDVASCTTLGGGDNTTNCPNRSGNRTFSAQSAAPSAPSLVSPNDGATISGTVVTLQWNAVSGAGAYSVGLRDLNTNQLFSIPLITSTSTTQTVTAGHSYRWDVASCISSGGGDNTTNCPNRSGNRTFSVQSAAPAAPSLVSPADGATISGTVVTLQWNAVSGAGAYSVGLRDLNTNQLFSIALTTGTSTVQSVTAGHSYRWDVASCISSGGGDNTTNCPNRSGNRTFSVQGSAAAPSISSVSPNPVTGSNSAQPFTINGSNFVSGANVTLRDLSAGQTFANRTPTSFSSTQIVLSTNFTTAAHSWSVEVINPDGQSSGQFSFSVVAPSSAAPSISSVSPNPVTGSNSAQPFTINGSNFVSGANITLRDLSAGQTFANRTPTSFSSTQIVLSTDFTTAAHSWSVEVINPDGKSSGQFSFSVVAPSGATPSISSVSPNPVTGSNSAQPFTIHGNNFVSGANVTLRDVTAGQTFANRPASSFSSTQIVLNPNFTTAAHSWSVEVINPDGQSSGQFSFNVVAPTSSPPSISSVSPNPVTGSDSSQPFTIHGTNFVSGANVMLRDLTAGQSFPNRPASSFSSTQIILNPNFTTAAHSWSVEVINPDGQSSGQFSFSVVVPSGPPPSISSVDPDPVLAFQGAQRFTINGSHFINGANIILRDELKDEMFDRRSALSFTEAKIVLNPNFSDDASRWSVEVINPDGESTGRFFFNVISFQKPRPVISEVNPNPVVGAPSKQSFTIRGRNFVAGANVTLRDQTAGQIFTNRSPVAFSSEQIALLVNFSTNAHKWSVQVTNPDGQFSEEFEFRVVGPKDDQMSLNILVIGDGSVQTTPPGEACGPGCRQFPKGQTVQLTPQEAKSKNKSAKKSVFSFVGWADDCSGVTCLLRMVTNKHVTALFSRTSNDNFSLKSFPLKGQHPGEDLHLAPETADVISIFDHSMNRGLFYQCDDTVMGFDEGIKGEKTNGSDADDCKINGKPQHPGYRQQSHHDFEISGLNYVGSGGQRQYLNYDGHPGYDYRADLQTEIYAPTSGTIYYPRNLIGLSSQAFSEYHVLAMVPDGHGEDYRIYFLHLSTHPSSDSVPLAPQPGCYTMGDKKVNPNVLPLPTNIHVKQGCLIGLTGDAGAKNHPHLHFEVHRILPKTSVPESLQKQLKCLDENIDSRRVCVPVDPYGWRGSETDCSTDKGDPYECLTGVKSVNLWNVQ